MTDKGVPRWGGKGFSGVARCGIPCQAYYTINQSRMQDYFLSRMQDYFLKTIDFHYKKAYNERCVERRAIRRGEYPLIIPRKDAFFL
jgi:hypothetical protein